MSAADAPSPPGTAIRPDLLDRDAPLGRRSWFGAGGTADWLFAPTRPDELRDALCGLDPVLPVHVVGRTSNLLVRDGGVRGLVVRLAGAFGAVERDGDGLLCGAAALDMATAEFAAACGLADLEFLSGIPGSIGGAVAMNAGAHGSELADVLDWVEILRRDGTLARLRRDEIRFGYRHCGLPPDAIVIRARLRGRPDDPGRIRALIAAHRRHREEAQPVKARTGGSTFRNPAAGEGRIPAAAEGRPRKAWELIDAVGGRGLRIGDAMISEKHCNFLINLGRASAAELEALGEEVRRRVLDDAGIDLHWEIRRIGEPC